MVTPFSVSGFERKAAVHSERDRREDATPAYPFWGRAEFRPVRASKRRCSQTSTRVIALPRRVRHHRLHLLPTAVRFSTAKKIFVVVKRWLNHCICKNQVWERRCGVGLGGSVTKGKISAVLEMALDQHSVRLAGAVGNVLANRRTGGSVLRFRFRCGSQVPRSFSNVESGWQ